MDAFRRVALAGTELCRAQVDTIRLRPLKVGGVVLRNTRRICIQLCSHFVGQDIFEKALRNLLSG